MPPGDRRARIDKVRKVLTPKGPLSDCEAITRNDLRLRLTPCDRPDAEDSCDAAELESFVRAIALAQETLTDLTERAMLLRRESEALDLLLEAASTIDMLESDLLEFPLVTPAMCRDLTDKIRASVLKPFELKHFR